MPLKFKKNMMLINALFFLGYANILHADECGVLRYMANKSNGVAVTGNTCKTVDDIALGSEFNLMPGARLWFKSQTSADAKKMQGICQNRSSTSIHISVDSDKLPWIKPTGLTNCNAWTDNKMNCGNSVGGSNVLSCVIAAVDYEQHPKGLEERTTSVRMRSLPTMDDAEKNDTNDAESGKDQIVSAMKADVDLCRVINHTDARVQISWLVETNSRVNTVIPAADRTRSQNDADKPFIDCLTAVIKDFSYPQSSKAIWLSNQF